MLQKKISPSLFSALIILIITQGCMNATNLPHVSLSTQFGEIVLEIDTVNAPITAANFLRYIDEDRYTGASFYRVVTRSNQPNDSLQIEVIQGGLGFDESPLQLPTIAHETTSQTRLLHKNAVISMARLQPGTASSEFFICIHDQPELDFGGMRNRDGQGFAAFGRVVSGMHVVTKIQGQDEHEQMLISPVTIMKVSRTED